MGTEPSPFLRYLSARDQFLDLQSPAGQHLAGGAAGARAFELRSAMDELRPLLTDGERAYIAAQGDWRFTNPPPPSQTWRWTGRVVRTVLFLPWLAVYGAVCLVGATFKALQEAFDQLKDDADDVLEIMRDFLKGLNR